MKIIWIPVTSVTRFVIYLLKFVRIVETGRDDSFEFSDKILGLILRALWRNIICIKVSITVEMPNDD